MGCAVVPLLLSYQLPIIKKRKFTSCACTVGLKAVKACGHALTRC